MSSCRKRQIEKMNHFITKKILPILVNRDFDSDVLDNFLVFRDEKSASSKKPSIDILTEKMKQVGLKYKSLNNEACQN